MKKKLLIEGISSNLGGIEIFVYNLVKMGYDKYEIYIMLYNDTNMPFQEELEDLGCKFIYVTHRKDNYLQHLKDLKNMYLSNEFDIIHINLVNFSPFERILYAKKYTNAKIILHSHSSNLFNISFKNTLLHSLGDLVIKKSKYCKIACGEDAGKFLFKSNKFYTIRNGINIEKFMFSDKYNLKVRKELNIKKNDFVIGHVGSLEEVKNQEFLINIFYEILSKNKNSKLLIVGEGSLKNKLERQIEKLNIKSQVLLLGKRIDMNELYSAFDIFVMPSISEGLSISIIEAQINGLMCYTSDTVDKNSNVMNRVEFLSLDTESNLWADTILKYNNERDKEIKSKIPKEYDMVNSYKKLFTIYEME